MPYYEEYMGVEIVPVETIGKLHIYRRCDYRTMNLPKYVVFDHQGSHLKDARTKREALRFVFEKVHVRHPVEG